MKQLRIAHIVNEISPAGKETGIVKLIRNHNEDKFRSVIIASEGIHPLHFEPLNDLRIYNLNKRPGNDFSLPGKIAKICKEEAIDIIHSHAWGTLLESYLATRFNRKMCWVHTEHGSLKSGWKQRYLQKMIWRRADRLGCVADAVRQNMSRMSGISASRISVLHNGVDTSLFYPDADLRSAFRKQFHFDDQDIIVGSVGRFLPVKNHQLLIRAGAKVIKSGDEIKIALVSLGPLQDELVELSSSLGIGKNVRFLGLQQHINLILNGIDIFVLPSQSEGCSNVIQEAMVCAKPIIATDVGGNPELIRHRETGLLVDPGRPEKLAAAIQSLIHNKQLSAKYGMNARKDALHRFTVEKMVERYEAFYEQAYLIAQNR